MIRHTEKNMVYLFFIDIFSLPIIFWFADDVARRADNLKIQTLNFCFSLFVHSGQGNFKKSSGKKKLMKSKSNKRIT